MSISYLLRHGALVGLLLPAVAWSQDLTIVWPEHWEYRSPRRQGPAIHLQAREQNDGVTLETLDVTIIDARSAQKPITSESIKALASKLRDASLSTSIEKSIPLREFPNHRGYYFVASDAHLIGAAVGSFKQMIEGVMYESECLVNFTLLTNDASSVDAQGIVNALSELKLTPLPNSVRPLPQGAR
jgi:hypothetical protein